MIFGPNDQQFTVTLLTWKNFHKEGQRKNKKAFRLFLQGGQQKRAKNINFFLFFCCRLDFTVYLSFKSGKLQKGCGQILGQLLRFDFFVYWERSYFFLLGKMKQSSPGHCVNLDLFGWRNTGIKIVFLVSLFEICS